MTTVKSFYAARELAAMHLSGMPATEQGIRVCAAREGWEARRRVKGKGMEYAFASLLASVQDEIRRRAASALVSKVSTDRLLPARREQQLGLVETNAQRLKADARKGLLTALERLMAQCHISPVVSSRSREGFKAFLIGHPATWLCPATSPPQAA